MKKVFLSIWLLIYLIPAQGIDLQFHYCFGKLKSVSLHAETEGQCGCNSKWGCCDYIFVNAKITDPYQIADYSNLDQDETKANQAPLSERLHSFPCITSHEVPTPNDFFPPPERKHALEGRWILYE
ncbi:MAG: hypothetical protein AAFY71_16650 [Bacteroidota bacterium]